MNTLAQYKEEMKKELTLNHDEWCEHCLMKHSELKAIETCEKIMNEKVEMLHELLRKYSFKEVNNDKVEVLLEVCKIFGETK